MGYFEFIGVLWYLKSLSSVVPFFSRHSSFSLLVSTTLPLRPPSCVDHPLGFDQPRLSAPAHLLFPPSFSSCDVCIKCHCLRSDVRIKCRCLRRAPPRCREFRRPILSQTQGKTICTNEKPLKKPPAATHPSPTYVPPSTRKRM